LSRIQLQAAIDQADKERLLQEKEEFVSKQQAQQDIENELAEKIKVQLAEREELERALSEATQLLAKNTITTQEEHTKRLTVEKKLNGVMDVYRSMRNPNSLSTPMKGAGNGDSDDVSVMSTTSRLPELLSMATPDSVGAKRLQSMYDLFTSPSGAGRPASARFDRDRSNTVQSQLTDDGNSVYGGPNGYTPMEGLDFMSPLKVDTILEQEEEVDEIEQMRRELMV
jgi:hypothetical protein